MSLRPSFRPKHLSSHRTDFHEIFTYKCFSKNLSRKFKFSSNLTRIPGMCALLSCYAASSGNFLPSKTTIQFWSYLAHFFLEWEMFQAKVVKKIKTHILFSVMFFFFENHAVYGIVYTNIVDTGRLQVAIWRIPISRYITKPRETYCHTYITLHCFTLLYSFDYHKISDKTDRLCYVCEHKYIGVWANMVDTRGELTVFRLFEVTT